MDDAPWVAVPYDAKKERRTAIEKVIPNVAYPTPGVVRADGTVVEADVFGKVNDDSLSMWSETKAIKA
tara:strand:+ start:425 stop:628 length:204 start_codon:yes stop_codon:yes gene_type:complete